MSTSAQPPQDEVKHNWDNAIKLADLGRERFYSGDLDEAENCLRRVLELAPDDSASESFLAGTLLAAGKFDESEKLLQNLIKRNPKSSFAHGTLAKLYYQRGSSAKAFESVRQSVQLDPNNLNSLRMFYHHFREQNQVENALHELEELSRANATSWGPCYILAGHYQLQKDFEKAIEWMRQGLEKSPNNVDLLKAFTGLLGQMQRYEEIIETVEKAQKQGEVGLGAKFNLLQAYLETGNKEKSRVLLADLRREAPDSWQNVLQFYDQQLSSDIAKPE